METFSLIQDSLDQTLTLEALEVASDAVSTITRMDLVYPSLMSYEKEICWHFHQLKSGV